VAFHLDRTFVFDHDVAVVWDALSRPADYPRWWSWLREIDIDALAEGVTAHCLIRAPVPFALRLALRVDRLVPGRRIEVTAAGDLRGAGSLELGGHPRGSTARLVWELTPQRRLLGAVGLVSGPLLQWGQDWVVATGVRQFRQKAFAGQDKI
jgi:uncharacterized protein YndB with AHSA1/START domain